MILHRLTLHDFGVYRGRHVVDLVPPSRERPVILVRGENGTGKTTLADALFIALYGIEVQCTRRYDGASVEVDLSHTTRGTREHIHVERRFTRGEEHLSVSVDGALFTGHWAERVEEILPLRLSRLFFFDAEAIEALADLDRGADAMREALYGLSGLDVVDHLVTDLASLEHSERSGDEMEGHIGVHAARMQGAMQRFRQSLFDQRLSRVAGLSLAGFRTLLHHTSLVTDLTIDPETLAMTLIGRDRCPLPPERLGSGARKLLAIAVLWALARASGRALPVVIDAPFGRLDAAHRRRLAEHYLPFASHQVIILSTSDAIDRACRDKLAPSVGLSYLLRHDDETGATCVR